MINAFKFLIRNFGQYRRHIAFLAALGFTSSVLGGLGIGAVIPLFSVIIGEGEPSGDPVTSLVLRLTPYFPLEGISGFLAFIVAVFLLRFLLLFAFGIIRARILYQYKVSIVNNLFGGLIKARWSFLLTQKSGYVQNVLMRDADKSADLLDAISYLPFAFVSVSVFLGFAFTISAPITLVTVAVGLVIIGAARPLLGRIKRTNALLAVENKTVSQFLIEHLIGAKNLRIGAPSRAVLEKSNALFRLWKRIEMKTKILSFFNKNFLEPVSVLFIAGAVALSYNTLGFRIETFAVALLLIQRAFVYMQQTQSALYSIVETLPYAEHAYAFKDMLAREAEEGGGTRTFQLNAGLAFENVSFSYVPERTVLCNVNFSVRKGETIGLIGPSGVGKTSVADLILRLFEPSGGRISVDGIGAHEFALEEWRKRIGYVSQDVFLLNDTIANNIKFYNEDVNEEDMKDAARRAHIDDVVLGLKDGFDTVVGDRGVMLSGGQRQRVALARALARNPELLVLDEATSALDMESEIAIHRALQSLKGKVTTLIIAHRLSTVADVDRILVLDRGKIAEEGRPQELFKNPQSYFYRMYHINETPMTKPQ